MAYFEQHCLDCKRLLGERFENVNRWMDELFTLKGPKHRRFRHHWGGVCKARKLFGEGGAKAAIVHLVRDCGTVPQERDYDMPTFGILRTHEFLVYDEEETAAARFKAAVEKEWRKLEAPNENWPSKQPPRRGKKKHG